MAVRRQASGARGSTAQQLASWSRRRTHPAESRQASKAPANGNSEIRKAATPAAWTEVCLAAIHSVVDKHGARPVTRASTARSRIRKNSRVSVARCVHSKHVDKCLSSAMEPVLPSMQCRSIASSER